MGFFDTVDGILDFGGQTVLDAVNLVPAYGEAVSGAQAVYHGAHAVSDLMGGNYQGAMQQGGSALWNGINAIPGVHEALEPVHVAELMYDAGANGMNIGGALAGGGAHPFQSRAGAVGGAVNEHGRFGGLAETVGGWVGSALGIGGHGSGHGGGH